MAHVVFTCPATSMNVQHLLEDDQGAPDNEYEGSLARLAPSCTSSIERLASCWAKANNKPGNELGRRTCERWRPRWSRCFSGKKLIAGRLDLKPGIVQPLNDDFGRVFGVKDLRWKVGAAEQVGENVLRGELAHGFPRSPCHLASYSVSSFDSMQAR
jgi:hypothetical protein